jgi:hypothetical protein
MNHLYTYEYMRQLPSNNPDGDGGIQCHLSLIRIDSTFSFASTNGSVIKEKLAFFSSNGAQIHYKNIFFPSRIL